MSKNIFLNRFFFPDHSATSQILSELAFELAKNKDNKEIHIVTSQQQYDKPFTKLKAYELIDNVHIHRVKATRYGRKKLLGRAIDYFSFYITATIKLFQLTKKGDTLIAKTDPPLISVIAAIVARYKKANLVNWLQDIFPEVAAELGIKFAQGYLYKLLKDIRNYTLEQAKMNVVIGELMAEKLLKEGVKKDSISIIFNWVDGDKIIPVSPAFNSLRKKWKLERKFVVGYSGNLGRAHDYKTMLKAAEAMQDDLNIMFLFIGGGANYEILKQEAERLGLKNIIFKPYQSISTLSQSLSAADVHLITLDPSLEGLIVPSKIYGVLAVGRPILFIGSKKGEFSTIISKNECGGIIEIGENDLLIKEIREMSKKPNMYKIQCDNSRLLYLENFKYGNSIKQWELLLGSL